MSDEDYSNVSALMYPSSWPTNLDDAHCTLLYLGENNRINTTPAAILDVLDSLNLVIPGRVRTKHAEFFGPEKDIPVVTLESNLLNLQRLLVEDALRNELGVENASEFKTFKPHVTVKEDPGAIPEYVHLGALALWWGDEKFEV